MDSYALIYIGSALLGAVVGGAISVAISLWGSRRQRRIRYGENLLDTLTDMKRKLALLQEVGTCSSTQPLVLREEALGFWVQVELAASLENRSNRRIMRSWAEGIFNGAYQGASSDEELTQLDTQLEVAIFLVIAWTAGHARGADFARPDAQVLEEFSPGN